MLKTCPEFVSIVFTALSEVFINWDATRTRTARITARRMSISAESCPRELMELSPLDSI